MKKFSKTVERSQPLSLTTRTDKFGNIVHCVEFLTHDGSKDFALFRHLSSALDFVGTNFM